MALVLKDRVKETTSTSGTGSITLLGAVQGFQGFSSIGEGNTTYYSIVGTSEWEVGIGTYSGGVLSRDTVIASSANNAKVGFSSGVKDVFCTYPADKAVSTDNFPATGAVGSTSPNATVNVASLTANVTSTNGDFALVPKGTGALLADIPDNLAAGGNKRGTRAVDWQMFRGSADLVASGNYAVIGGGQSNKASGNWSTVGGGDFNYATAKEATIAGGYANAASATWATIAGGTGNTASGEKSVIAGGDNNSATAESSVVSGGSANSASQILAFIGGGISNTSAGLASSVIGGSYNSASGTYASVCGGAGNSASGAASVICGGGDNAATGKYSFIGGGVYGTTRGIDGYHVFPACNAPIATSAGVSQAGMLVVAVQTTNATPTVARSNTSSAGTDNQLVLANNSIVRFYVSVVAGVTGGGNSKSWSIEGHIKRGANAASTTLGIALVSVTHADSGTSGWGVAATADTTNGALAITVTGQASTTIRWVCSIQSTEVTY